MRDDNITWAAATAERLLAPLGQRWVHTVAVAKRARVVADNVEGVERGELLAAAYLHDIGYAPALHDTGHHGLDGARYLRGRGRERLACLVAHHSGAAVEATARGLGTALAAFPREDSPTADALTYCDLTTDLLGRTVTLDDRLADIADRYGETHTVTRAARAAWPDLARAVHATQQLLQADGVPAPTR